MVNCKRVRRLLRLMWLEAICPKPRLSLASPGRQIYPYLLRGVKVTRVNQVWSADITYVRLLGGVVYLVAIIDWRSRYVLSWEVSTTMEPPRLNARKIRQDGIFTRDRLMALNIVNFAWGMSRKATGILCAGVSRNATQFLRRDGDAG